MMLLLMTWGCAAWCDPASTSLPGTTLQAVGDIYDFGSQSALDLAPITHTFVLKAGSGASVVVDRLQPSCHCTQAVAQAEMDGYGRFTVAAGGTAKIAVTFNPSDVAPGPVEKEVYVFAVGGSTPIVTLHIKGTITPPVAFSLPVLDFGAAPSRTARTLPLTVTFDPRFFDPGQTARLVCSDPALRVIRQGTESPAEKSQTYLITVPAGMSPGKFRATLFVSLFPRSASSDTVWSIPVRGEVLSAARAYPAKADCNSTGR